MAGLPRLSDYLASIATKRWGYGSLDCCTFMADWVLQRYGLDPMQDRRGTYSTRRQYRRALASEGGIIASCSARFQNAGFVETSIPKAGDMALVATPTPTGSICVTKDRFAIVTSDMGLLITKLPAIKVWTFNG
jgi:hypothetical protein